MRHLSIALIIIGLAFIVIALPGAIHTFTAADAPVDGLKGALMAGTIGAITAGIGATIRTIGERHSHRLAS